MATGWQPSRGACVVCMIAFTRNPPTTGSAPIAPAADGSHPTPTAAAPAASNATGREFSAPASESVELQWGAGDFGAAPDRRLRPSNAGQRPHQP